MQAGLASVLPRRKGVPSSHALVGRIGVYFAKSGGGIIIYDDVAHKWPIRLPFKKLGRVEGTVLKYKHVSPSVRRVTLDTSRVELTFV
jgi:hypothetical protein